MFQTGEKVKMKERKFKIIFYNGGNLIHRDVVAVTKDDDSYYTTENTKICIALINKTHSLHSVAVTEDRQDLLIKWIDKLVKQEDVLFQMEKRQIERRSR